jgi:DNA-binding NarL/FixJ family response regulator
MSLRVLIVEDDPIIADDIESVLANGGFDIAGKAYTSSQAFDQLASRYPDLVLLDILIKGDKDGIDIAQVIRQKYQLPFIYITSFSDPDTLNRAKPTMPYGYIVKPFRDRDIITAIDLGMYRHAEEQNKNQLSKDDIEKRHGLSLTKMEFKIIELIWQGRSNQKIAEELFISVNTVKSHIKNIFGKFEVKNRSELLVRLR